EQRKINKVISVSSQVMNLLTSGELRGNIGELKNIVKITVAKAFSDQKQESEIHLTIYHLPEIVLNKIGREFQTTNYQEIRIDESSSSKELIQNGNPNRQKILDTFENMLVEFKKSNYNLNKCEEQYENEVDLLFDILIFEA